MVTSSIASHPMRRENSTAGGAKWLAHWMADRIKRESENERDQGQDVAFHGTPRDLLPPSRSSQGHHPPKMLSVEDHAWTLELLEDIWNPNINNIRLHYYLNNVLIKVIPNLKFYCVFSGQIRLFIRVITDLLLNKISEKAQTFHY